MEAAIRRRRRFEGAFTRRIDALEPRLMMAADVLTYHNDNLRTGQNPAETILTPANVNAATFGKLGQVSVDGAVYAQPLTEGSVAIPGRGTHNVVFVATEHDSVYAFDADTFDPLWHVSFINPASGVTSVPTIADYQQDLNPEYGITSTPVIDKSTGTLYLVAETQEPTAAGVSDVLRLHALDITTGAERFGGPVPIAANVHGKGADRGPGNVIPFDPAIQIQRPGLLLSGGVIYTAYSSLGDFGPFHGWVLANDAHTLQTVAVFNATPDGRGGGIWMSGGGLGADSAGNVYAQTGNGTFTASSGGRGYSDSVLKLNRNLRVTDYFTPSNQKHLSDIDRDLGSGGVLLVPDQSGRKPHLLIAGGKDGNLHVLNRDRLGGYRPKGHHDDQLIPNPGHPVFATPAYSNGMVYVHSVKDVLKQYLLANGRLTLVATTSTPFNFPGATPSISSSGASNGIVWEIQATGSGKILGQATLHAYDAANVGRELYNSNQAGGRDKAGGVVKFTVPTVADGKVFVGGRGTLTVFGLLPPRS